MKIHSKFKSMSEDLQNWLVNHGFYNNDNKWCYPLTKGIFEVELNKDHCRTRINNTIHNFNYAMYDLPAIATNLHVELSIANRKAV